MKLTEEQFNALIDYIDAAIDERMEEHTSEDCEGVSGYRKLVLKEALKNLLV